MGFEMKVYLLMAMLAAAGSAAAQEAPLPVYGARAVLASPAASSKVTVIDGRAWRCDGAVCVGRASATPRSQPVIFECQRVAKALGPVVRYATREEREERTLGPDCRNPG
jgi:hypothetical protein